MDELEKRAEEYAREATHLDPKTQYHMLKFRIARLAYIAGVRAERERQQWMFDSWKKEEADWIAENVRLREALEGFSKCCIKPECMCWACEALGM